MSGLELVIVRESVGTSPIKLTQNIDKESLSDLFIMRECMVYDKLLHVLTHLSTVYRHQNVFMVIVFDTGTNSAVFCFRL